MDANQPQRDQFRFDSPTQQYIHIPQSRKHKCDNAGYYFPYEWERRIATHTWQMWYLDQSQRCICPTNYTGQGCDLVENDGACDADTEVFDNSFTSYDDSAKTIECEVNAPKGFPCSGMSCSLISLRDHRVNLTIWANATKANVAMYSRMSQYTCRPPDPPMADNCNNGKSWSGDGTEVMKAIECELSDCSGGVDTTNPNREVFKCESANCTTCGKHYCALIEGALTGIKTPYFTFTKGAVPGVASTEVKFGPLIFDSVCRVGRCVNINSTIHNGGFTPATGDGLTEGEKVAVGVTSTVLLLLLAGVAFWCYRSRQAAKKKRLKLPGRKASLLNSSELRSRGKHQHQMSINSPNNNEEEQDHRMGFGLVWRNVSRAIQVKDKGCCKTKSRLVLDKISGCVRPGEMVAILGPSGAGKTTLLNILADRRRRYSGVIQCYGRGLQGVPRGDVISYVQQFDSLLYTQTVKESLMFSARLRLPAHLRGKASLERRVQHVMQQLKIDHIADSLIGNPDIGGISGGERKRVDIGIELVVDPGLLLLDEPTSGLDSTSVDVLMRVLQDVSAGGCSCLFTIHQVPGRFFNKFDKVMLLSRTGNTTFFGPPAEGIAFFERLGYPMPVHANPAEFALDMASLSPDDHLASVVQAFDKSSSNSDLLEQCDDIILNRYCDTEYLLAKKKFKQSKEKEPDDDAKEEQEQDEQEEIANSLSVGQQLKTGSKLQSINESFSLCFEKGRLCLYYHTDADDVKLTWSSPSTNGAYAVVTETAQLEIRNTEGKALWRTSLPEEDSEGDSHKDGTQASLVLQEDGNLVLLNSAGEEVWCPFESNVVRLQDRPVRNCCVQMKMILHRDFLHLSRDLTLLLVTYVTTTTIAIFLGGVYVDLKLDIQGAQNRMGLLLFIIIFFSLTSLSAIGTFINVKHIFRKERSAGFYSTMPFYLAKAINDIVPLRLMPPIIFASILYQMSGLNNNPSEKVVVFFSTLVLVNVVSSLLCLMISALFKSVGTANFVAVVLFIISIVFGGLFLNGDTNTGLAKIGKLSFIKYAYEIFFVNEFVGLEIDFKPKGYDIKTALSGDILAQNWGMDTGPSTIPRDTTYLLVFAITLAVLGYLFLVDCFLPRIMDYYYGEGTPSESLKRRRAKLYGTKGGKVKTQFKKLIEEGDSDSPEHSDPSGNQIECTVCHALVDTDEQYCPSCNTEVSEGNTINATIGKAFKSVVRSLVPDLE